MKNIKKMLLVKQTSQNVTAELNMILVRINFKNEFQTIPAIPTLFQINTSFASKKITFASLHSLHKLL